MATDIKTTTERMSILINASNMLRQIAKMCADTQKYHDSCSDFQNRSNNIENRMTAIQSMITAVSNELSELAASANMEFQYEWVAGRNGVNDIYVDSASRSVALRHTGGTVVSGGMYAALAADNVIRLQGSALNSQYLVVLSMGTGASVAHLTSAVATETLLSRVIKEMD